MAHDFAQLDVFGTDPVSGNPLAVVFDAEDLTTERMRAFAVWSNLSECTFVLPPTTPEADYRVRIFGHETELPFAGHPTLGTVRAWLDRGGAPRTPGLVVQECGAGLVPVRVEPGLLSFAAPPLVRSGAVAPDTVAAIIAVLGVDPESVVATEWLDNGPGWIGVLLDSAETVLALEPDAARHPGDWNIGVIAPTPAGDPASIELRAFFSDASGALLEDPVTGSLNAAVAQWMLTSGRLSAPYRARQGTAVGRRGEIHVVRDDAGIWIGGKTHPVIQGTIEI